MHKLLQFCISGRELKIKFEISDKFLGARQPDAVHQQESELADQSRTAEETVGHIAVHGTESSDDVSGCDETGDDRDEAEEEEEAEEKVICKKFPHLILGSACSRVF